MLNVTPVNSISLKGLSLKQSFVALQPSQTALAAGAMRHSQSPGLMLQLNSSLLKLRPELHTRAVTGARRLQCATEHPQHYAGLMTKSNYVSPP